MLHVHGGGGAAGETVHSLPYTKSDRGKDHAAPCFGLSRGGVSFAGDRRTHAALARAPKGLAALRMVLAPAALAAMLLKRQIGPVQVENGRACPFSSEQTHAALCLPFWAMVPNHEWIAGTTASDLSTASSFRPRRVGLKAHDRKMQKADLVCCFPAQSAEPRLHLAM